MSIEEPRDEHLGINTCKCEEESPENRGILRRLLIDLF